MIDFDNFDTIDKTSLIKKTLPKVQNNNTQKNDFDRLQEIFQIDEVGIMRLSKLVPDHMDNHEIFDEDFQRKIEFYQKFLWLKIQVNIIENEIFAWYKKVSVDIDGKINAQMWKYIFTQMIPYLESSGFQKSFLSLETLKDIPNEVFEQYMQFVNADFLQEKQNVVKDIILWLELAICTKLSQKRWYGDMSEMISWHENFQDALLHISHVAKMDNEFQEKLEEMYVSLLRYKNPKIQSLLKMLGYNVNASIASKKLIARTRSQFSISVAKILWSFGKKEEKPKKKIPVLSFRSAKKLLGSQESKKIWYIPWEKIRNSTRILNTGIVIEKDEGHFVDNFYLEQLKNACDNLVSIVHSNKNRGSDTLRNDLNLKELEKIFLIIWLDFERYNTILFNLVGWFINSNFDLSTIRQSLEDFLDNRVIFVKWLKESLGTDVIINGRKNANYKFHIDTTKTDEYGRITFPEWYKINNGFNLDIFWWTQISELVVKNSNQTELEDKTIQTGYQVTLKNLLHWDYTLEISLENQDKYIMSFHCDPDYSWGKFSFCDVTLKQVAGKIRVGKNIGRPVGTELLDNPISTHDIYTKVSTEVATILLPFEGIVTLENIFLERQTLDIQSIFWENLREILSGRIFFDPEGFLHIDGKIDVQKLIQKSDFWICVKWVLIGDFDEENFWLQKEKLTFVGFLDFVKEIQTRLQSYQEKDTKNGIAQLLQEHLEIFKTDEKKRKLLSEIIVAKKQEFHPDLLDFYRELGKIDKDFRKFYTLSSLPKIEKVQVLKTLLSRNHLDLWDVWWYLSDELKNKFFASFWVLFDYETKEERFNELFSWIQKELQYLLGDDISDILVIFDGLFWDDNFLALNEEISQIWEESPIKKDLKVFFLECAEKRKKQIEASKEKIEQRKRERQRDIQECLKLSNNFDSIIEVKRVLWGFTSEEFSKYVPNSLQEEVRKDIVSALKKWNFVTVGYYLQLDDEWENFLQALQKQDFNNTSDILKFTQKYRWQGVMISQVCVLIDNYIVVRPTPKVKLMTTSEQLEEERIGQERKKRKKLAADLSQIYTEAREIKNNIIIKDEKIINMNEKNIIKYYNTTKLKE